MKPITENKAFDQMCHASMSRQQPIKCLGSRCVAWEVVHPRIEREDHSGAKEMMMDQVSKRDGQMYTRTGPDGCDGVLIFEEMGICGLLK